MGVLVPRVGVTACDRAKALLENYSDNIVGTFWVMSGYGFDDDVPGWWVDLVLEENQAQAILDAHERGAFAEEHDAPLYLGFCIIVTAEKNNPASFSYVVQHLRMVSFEGIGLLKILAKHNIPAHTEVSYPRYFLHARYDYKEELIPKELKDLYKWSAQTWEDYCSYLLAEHGQDMTRKYWSKPR